MRKLSQDTGDGWKEIMVGAFFNETGEDGTRSPVSLSKELSSGLKMVDKMQLFTSSRHDYVVILDVFELVRCA